MGDGGAARVTMPGFGRHPRKGTPQAPLGPRICENLRRWVQAGKIGALSAPGLRFGEPPAWFAPTNPLRTTVAPLVYVSSYRWGTPDRGAPCRTVACHARCTSYSSCFSPQYC